MPVDALLDSSKFTDEIIHIEFGGIPNKAGEFNCPRLRFPAEVRVGFGVGIVCSKFVEIIVTGDLVVCGWLEGRGRIERIFLVWKSSSCRPQNRRGNQRSDCTDTQGG